MLNARLLETLDQVAIINDQVASMQTPNSVASAINNSTKIRIEQTQEKAILSAYSIFIQYHSKDNKDIVHSYQSKLIELGYSIPEPEQTDFKSNSIRYYHVEDRIVAERLRQQVNLLYQNSRTDIRISEITYLGYKYKNVPEKTIEFWMSL